MPGRMTSCSAFGLNVSVAPDTLILPIQFLAPMVGLIKADGDRFDHRFK